MDFEDFFLSFIKQVRKDDIENIIPLLIINELIDVDDLLDTPNYWLKENCAVIAEGDGFQIYQETKGKRRMFVEDISNPSEPYPIQVKCHIVAKEEVLLDEYDEYDIDVEKHEADYCAELLNSTHLNMDGKTVTTCAWFVVD